MTLRIAVAGATGRLGCLIAARIIAAPDLVLAARLVRPGTAGDDTTDDVAAALGDADLLIEATRGGAVAGLARAAAQRGIAFISGTTGLDDEDRAALDDAAKTIPVLHA
jgi:4-hydroxy-tetrahydrodipicolinate reductase